MRTKILLGVALACAGGLAIYAAVRPVLFSGSLPGSDHRIVLMSPFRDRQPEQIGRALLGSLRTSQCRELLLKAGHRSPAVDDFCGKEAAFVPDKYRLLDRKDSGASVRLEYEWVITSRQGWSGLAELVVARSNGRWSVVDYARAYSA